METAIPLLQLCLSLLSETRSLDLPSDHVTNAEDEVPIGPSRKQLDSAIEAIEYWLQHHGHYQPSYHPETPQQIHDETSDRERKLPPPTQRLNPELLDLTPPSSPMTGQQESIVADWVSGSGSPHHDDLESVISRISEMDDRLRTFKWSDPDITSISSLERFTMQIHPHRGGMDNGSLVKRLDMRCFDAVACEDMIADIVLLCPNLESILLAYTSICPGLTTLSSILCPGRVAGAKITSLALHSMGDALAPAKHRINGSKLSISSQGEVQLQPLKVALARLESLSIDTRVDAAVMEFIVMSAGTALRKFEVVNGTSQGNLEMLAAAIRVAAVGGDGPDDSHTLSFPPMRETLSPRHVVTLVERCPMLETVNLGGCAVFLENDASSALDPILDTIATRLPKLRALRTPAKISPVALTAVLSACPLLEDLDLGPLFASKPVSSLRALIDHGQSLRNLAFRWKSNTGSAPGGAPGLDPRVVVELEMAFFELLERRGRFLRGIDGLGWPASDRTLRSIARHCQNLDSLVLFPCHGVKSEAAVRDLVTRCRGLKHLELRGLGAGVGTAVAVAVEAAEREVRGRANGTGRRRLEVAK
ncbi:hypothetical protein HDU76_002741, partial [Blyttiomyces sp. JEL0837]